MQTDNNEGIVYVLINPAMPNLVKIGKTSRCSMEGRLSELYSTSVPLSFKCVFAGRVMDESRVEAALHRAFSPYRVNAKREFFEIDPDQAIAILELVAIENVTPDYKAAGNTEPKGVDSAHDTGKSTRPRLNFRQMGIPEGGILHYQEDPAFTAEVLTERTVLFNGNELSLSAATQILRNSNSNIQPCRYWCYQGKSLRTIYNETYGYR